MEKRERQFRLKMIGFMVYVCLSASGLTLMKMGLGSNSSVTLDKTGLSVQFNWLLAGGMCLYILSFLTSLIVMKGMDLSLYYPLSAGLIYIAVCVLSVVVLKEKIPFHQLVGMAVIFAGIIIMNVGKGK